MGVLGLDFQAELRTNLSRTQRDEQVHAVLMQLGLDKIEDQLIGDILSGQINLGKGGGVGVTGLEVLYGPVMQYSGSDGFTNDPANELGSSCASAPIAPGQSHRATPRMKPRLRSPT